MSVFDHFVKKHDYLVCVDSDGCAMDTMNCKHFRCFGPCMVKEWGLEAWKEEILARWNAINLFEMTRGINRFKGLALHLTVINEKYCAIPGVEALKHWADTAPALSRLLPKLPRTLMQSVFLKRRSVGPRRSMLPLWSCLKH